MSRSGGGGGAGRSERQWAGVCGGDWTCKDGAARSDVGGFCPSWYPLTAGESTRSHAWRLSGLFALVSCIFLRISAVSELVISQ